MKARPWLLGIGCLVACLVLLDLGLGWFALGGGSFLGRPVPPYGDVSQARWQNWAHRRLKSVQDAEDPPGALTHDALLGWTNLRNFRSHDGTQTTNSAGLRGRREYAELPAPGVLRVALFGESFIFGEEVADEAAFEAQLEALDPSLEALNYGVSGFGTDQALMRLRSEGLHSHAQVMCIGVMLENIVRNVSRFTRLRNPYVKSLGIKPRLRLVDGALVDVPSPFATETDVCNAVFDLSLPDRVRAYDSFAELPYDNWLWKSSLARLYIGWQGSKLRDYRRSWVDEQAEPFQLLLAILSAFDREARAAGAERSFVLLFPPKEDLALALAGGARFWDGLAPALATRGIATLDFTDALAARARELAGTATEPTAVAAKVFLRAHLNPLGNAVVAEQLHAALRAP